MTMRARRASAGLCQNIEGTVLDFVVVLARVQRVEISDAVDAEYHGLTFENELPLTNLVSGLNNPRITICPVVAPISLHEANRDRSEQYCP
jgi:hypothetical protein